MPLFYLQLGCFFTSVKEVICSYLPFIWVAADQVTQKKQTR